MIRLLFEHSTKTIILNYQQDYYNMKTGEKILPSKCSTYLPIKKEFRSKKFNLKNSQNILLKFNKYITISSNNKKTVYFLQDIGITLTIFDNSFQLSGFVPPYFFKTFIQLWPTL